jgi:hypothetical protein
MNRYFIFFCFIAACTSCHVGKQIRLSESSKLKYIGSYEIPFNKKFNGTTIGGLSGIDYDPKQGIYFLICDDRSAINPSRFYTARLFLSEKGIDSVSFVSVKYLLRPNGSVYPNSKQDPFHTPDPEGMRYDGKTGQLIWTSEGERIVKNENIVLEDPSVVIAGINGKYVDSFILPGNMHMHATEFGPRQNGVFEGLSLIKNNKELLVSVEEPLYEDGPRAGTGDSSAWIRIIRFNVKTRKPVAQYGYRIDPVAFTPQPAGAFRINGVPDILAINDHQLLVIERSFSTGRKPSTIKVFLAEMKGAEDIASLPTIEGVPFHRVEKKLLLNMDLLGIYTDNIEGVTLGPKLPNGHRSVIFVADNNFSADQITQFLLFEIE